MAKPDLRRLAPFAFMVVGIITGVILRMLLWVIIYRMYGPDVQPNWASFFIDWAGVPFLPEVSFGAVGLWVGFKHRRNLGTPFYPFVLALGLLYIGVCVYTMKIRTTPEATARAKLAGMSPRTAGLTLGNSTAKEDGIQFEVKRGEMVVGSVHVLPLTRFFWQDGGAFYGTDLILDKATP